MKKVMLSLLALGMGAAFMPESANAGPLFRDSFNSGAIDTNLWFVGNEADDGTDDPFVSLVEHTPGDYALAMAHNPPGGMLWGAGKIRTIDTFSRGDITPSAI